MPGYTFRIWVTNRSDSVLTLWPFLALTLLWLLNTDRVSPQWRNKPFSNILTGFCLVLFAWLAASEIAKAISSAFRG